MFTFDQLSRPSDFQSVSPGGHKGVKAVFELEIMALVISNNGKNGKSPREQFKLTTEAGLPFSLVHAF